MAKKDLRKLLGFLEEAEQAMGTLEGWDWTVDEVLERSALISGDSIPNRPPRDYKSGKGRKTDGTLCIEGFPQCRRVDDAGL
jgi:hypothetical protein